jgi:Family of unknown function (DUF5923)
MFSCFGFTNSSEDDREPLLPQYRDDTSLQNAVHEKLHSYQMIRALRHGYMPSTEQLVTNLRCLLAADVLNPSDPSLSGPGRQFIKHTKQLLRDFIILLQHKNNGDQIQDLLWLLSQSRISIDVDHLTQRASKAKAKADAIAG